MSANIWAILVAGGIGNRYGRHQNKLLESLGGEPVLLRSARQLATHPQVTGVIIVAHPDWEETYQTILEPLGEITRMRWTDGGVTRRDSVWNGLQMVPKTCTVVMIHDAARPLIEAERIDAALMPVLWGEAKGTSLGVPAQNTLKQVVSAETPWVSQTLDRSTVWQVHTPQVFLKDVLVEAHQTLPHDAAIHDDGDLVERLYPNQQAVLMVEDSPTNLKITTTRDLTLAQAYLDTFKAGVGV